MLKERGSRKVPLSHIEVSRYLSPPVRRLLLARPPFLQVIQRMTDDALKAYILQHPPVVYEAKRSKKHDDPLFCLANLHALYIAKNRFHGSERVRVTLVEAPPSQQTDAFALLFALSADACHALSPKEAGHYLVAVWKALASAQPTSLIDVSERFSNKTAFCDAFNLDRRLY
ncbi:hypothetical protein SAMN05878249_1552 [Vreelandella aquamarina]|uniref:Uncharacterized protein n=2 Tax=Vreelandella aquamarina TaxID=77097 RepID=A0A1N6DQJ0_9GAMM|nr:hypothetical protein SAMN05878249_1552 [Halomonas meridiana]SIN73069.1 hypothetical protein SAMN05878438_2988 [Halomonas meridiana]SIO41199.1 hypothetical protein SAMN05878442_3055 [Halomonas meridiana]